MSVVILTRQELYEKIWSKPMTILAKEFNLSDNGLRKICKKHDIPTPLMGYWQKIQYGKKTSVIKLPKKNNEEQIKINVVTSKYNLQESDHKFNLISERIKNNKLLVFKVPKTLKNPDPIIIKTQDNLRDRKPDDYSRIKNTIQTDKGFPKITATPKNIPRILIILNTLIKNFRILNYQLLLKDDGLAIIAFENEEINISIREAYNLIPAESIYGWKTKELVPNGKLAIKTGQFGTYEFVDKNKILLEDQIEKILIRIESDFLSMHERRELRKSEQQRKEQLEKIEQKQQQIKKNELDKFKKFYNDAHRWKRYNVLKDYFDFIKALDNKSPQTEEWLEWASKKLDWYNPLVDIKEDLLDDIDKVTLTLKEKNGR